MSIDGILNINKPGGKTSFDIVRTIKRLSGERVVGHAGTLDPGATGVLPMCLGQATRVVPYLAEATKTYLTRIELGVSTDTYDAEGTVTRRANPSDTNREQLEAALPSFTGSILQTPPMYSAVKLRGRRLYELARAGIDVERPQRRASVFRLELIDWQPPFCTIEMECGKGTYVRSLVHDLGQRLGCGAHVNNLVRTRNGIFRIEDSIGIEQLETAFESGEWRELLYSIDAVLQHWAAAIVGGEKERAIRNGAMVSLENNEKGDFCRAYSIDGHFLAILRFMPKQGLWHPDRVFARS